MPVFGTQTALDLSILGDLVRKNFRCFLFMSLVLCGVSVNADSGAMVSCLNKVEELATEHGMSVGAHTGDNIRRCVEDFLILNSGKNFIPEEETCGPMCKLKQNAVSAYGAEDYSGLLVKSLSANQISKIEQYRGENTPLQERVSDSLKKFLTRNGGSVEGFEALKFIIIETVHLYVKAEVEAMGVTLGTNRGEGGIMEGLEDCLFKSQTDGHITTCVGKFKENAPYNVGELILTYYLEEHFKSKFTNEEYAEVQEAAFIGYATCGMNYYFDSNNSHVETSNRIKSCAYASLSEAFLKAAEETLARHMNIEGDQLSEAVVNFTQTCTASNIFKVKNSEQYMALGEYTPDEFKDLILSCVETFALKTLSQVGKDKVETNASVRALVAEEERSGFADKAIERGLSTCLEILPAGVSVSKCENILFTVAAQDLFELILKQKFETYKKKFIFIESMNISEIVAAGVSATSACNAGLYSDLEVFLEMSEREVEVKLAECFKVGIEETLQAPLETYIHEKIDDNTTLQKYRIRFGEEERGVIKNSFNQCVSNNLLTENGFESILESSKTFLDQCVFEVLKEVVLSSLDLILEKTLRSLGFGSLETRELLEGYRSQEENIFKHIEDANSKEEVEASLLTADKDILRVIADDVIKMLILKKSPLDFSQKDVERLTEEGKKSLFECIETEELSFCSVKTERDVMNLGVRIFLPGAVADEISIKLKPWLTGSDKEKNVKIEGLHLHSLFKSKIETPAGRNLVRLLVEEIMIGRSIEQVKEMREVLEFVMNVLESSQAHMEIISYYLIQPEINKSLNGLVGPLIFSGNFRRATDWRSIVKTLHGRAAMDLFKGYVREAVVEGRVPYMEQVSESMRGPIKAAIFEYEDIIQEHCPGRMRQGQCFEILDRVDQNL